MHQILIIDDDRSIREMLSILLRQEKMASTEASSVQEALQLLREQSFDLAFCDIQLDDGNGVDVLKESRSLCPDMPFVMITAYASPETAIEALKHGAYDYITKPFDVEELLHLVRRALERKQLRTEVSQLRSALETQRKIIGISPRMIEVYKTIGLAAPTNSTVLLLGESGTGKEIAARAIHEASQVREGPFISINCGAFPETLLESELFGYNKGAFTGANTNKTGLFEAAQGGTLFLDEIGELPLGMQVKLNRVLQERKVRRLGGTQETSIQVRCIAATNRDLQKDVAAGRFREDLYYRIAVLPIYLPPLRERKVDIALLAMHFLERFAARSGRRLHRISPEAIRLLEQYHWPGNVRELENIIERAVALEPGEEIHAEILPAHIRRLKTTAEEAPGEWRENQEEGFDLESYMQKMEKQILLDTLNRFEWNRTRAAEFLKLSYRSLRHKLQVYDIH